MKLFRHEKMLFDHQSADLHLQVVERGDQRELRFGNHIVQSARSLRAPDMLVLDYTRAMMSGFLFAPQAARILHIGLGAGSLASYIHRHRPDAQQRIVEIRPEVIDVAFRYFELPVSERLQVVAADGADHLRTDGERYDLIFLDAFHADGAAPHMNTPTLHAMLRAHLVPGGWLVNNVWGSDRENLNRVRSTMNGVYVSLFSLSVRADSNVIFMAGAEQRMPTQGMMQRRAASLSRIFPLDFEGLLRHLRPPFRGGAIGEPSSLRL